MLPPPQVVGGLLSLGDGHGAMGDGEVGGTGLEASLNAKLRVTLHKQDSLPPLLQVGGSWAGAACRAVVGMQLCGWTCGATQHACVPSAALNLSLHRQDLDYPLLETEGEYVVNGFSFADYLRELEVGCRRASWLREESSCLHVWHTRERRQGCPACTAPTCALRCILHTASAAGPPGYCGAGGDAGPGDASGLQRDPR